MVAEFTSSVIRFAQLLRQIMPTVQYLHHFDPFCPRTGRKGPINFASDHNSRIIFGMCILFLVFVRQSAACCKNIHYLCINSE
ncbi:hypothetical protein CSC02_1043 [Enterobacter hormaechei subsp. hoffmannii]|nr:hypothetical protein CSC02_1043 [Enterobacter hormaechei subsp. hoffmannii]